MFSSSRSKLIAGTVAIGGFGIYYAVKKYRKWSAQVQSKMEEKIQSAKIFALKGIAVTAVSIAAYCWLDMKLSRALSN